MASPTALDSSRRGAAMAAAAVEEKIAAAAAAALAEQHDDVKSLDSGYETLSDQPPPAAVPLAYAKEYSSQVGTAWFDEDASLQEAELCVLLCVPRAKSRGTVIDVPVRGTLKTGWSRLAKPSYRKEHPFRMFEDDAVIYKRLKEVYARTTPYWWRCIPFYGIRGVKEVKATFRQREEDHFVVTIERLDIPKILSETTAEIDETEATPIDIILETTCGNEWHHTQSCLEINAVDDDYLCPRIRHELARFRYGQMQKLDYFQECWHHPKVAPQRDTLIGMAQDSLVLRYEDMKIPIKNQPYHDIDQYPALCIDVGWQTKAIKRRAPYVAAAAIIAIGIYVEVTGDLTALATLSCFFMALAVIVLGYRIRL